MSQPTATVLVPTHDHASLIPHALRSILAQQFQDFEVFVVGDGAGPETRRIVEDVAAGDRRVRYFDFTKGERHGEAHRHRALEEAAGRIVAYCGDDDLWLPDHLANLVAGLGAADFVHTLHASVNPDGKVTVIPADLAAAEFRKVMIETTTNYFGPTVVGHTMAAYRALPVGWHPAPRGLVTDLHMWRKFLSAPGIRCRTLPEIDTVHLPSSLRRDWSPELRTRELAAFAERVSTASGVAAFKSQGTQSIVDQALRRERHVIQRRLRKAAAGRAVGWIGRAFKRPPDRP